MLWTSRHFFLQTAAYHSYAWVSRAALLRSAFPMGTANISRLAPPTDSSKNWSESCGEFENRAALVGAEIAALEGRGDKARPLRTGHRSARQWVCPHEALLNEIAARLLLARGHSRKWGTYLREARHCLPSLGSDWKDAGNLTS